MLKTLNNAVEKLFADRFNNGLGWGMFVATAIWIVAYWANHG